ncbi:mg639 protein [Tupanvirus deep ocean]|uniref:Mg639 protein n=2 Tax=Tupanvirus TaxID=2094720 RepID=A0AC62A7Y9_9VIRU|nr:mg639 protein [Tupanvirus deep ocean]QKU33743.1 mg639 protein [Tupanvirus deep ocean]
MDNSSNNTATIHISSDNLQKLKSVLEQLNIKIENVPTGSTIDVSNSAPTVTQQTDNKQNDEAENNIDENETNDNQCEELNVNENDDQEDTLEPLDLDDSIDDEMYFNDKDNNNNFIHNEIDEINDDDVCDLENNNNSSINETDDINEITPDDIINDENENKEIHNQHINNTNFDDDSELDLASEEDKSKSTNIHNQFSQHNTFPYVMQQPNTQNYNIPQIFKNANLNTNNMELVNPVPKNNQTHNKNISSNLISNKMINNSTKKQEQQKTNKNNNHHLLKHNTDKNKEIDNDQVLSKMEILKMENKITLNVGGKKFNLKKNMLEYLNINYGKLNKIIKDGRVIYFLDRDPYYFSKVISLIKLYGLDQDKIVEKLEDFSEQLINELCFYGIIDRKYNPRPKLRLKRAVTFPSRHDDIVKIVVDDQLFETSSGILSRSSYFDVKLKMSRSKQFYLSDIDAKIFRYVLNFLRTGELYTTNTEIIELLNNYGIEFEKIESKKISNDIVCHYIPHSQEAVNNQVLGSINFIDPRINTVSDNNGTMPYQFVDNKFYYPENMFVSPNAENFNVISTNSKLTFDSEIVFDLTDPTHDIGACIEDMLLCIDIPVLKPTEPYEYVDLIEYQLVESVSILSNNNNNKKIMLQTNSDLIYLYPHIYTDNANEYHDMTKIGDKKIKLLYDNALIDIHRITLPLFLFKDKRNILPIKKMINKKISAFMVVKMAPLKKLFKSKIKDIPLLNICLLSNTVNLAPGMTVHNPSENNQQNPLSIMPLNTELMNYPMLYVYDKIHSITIPIQTSPNPIYDVAVIPLDRFGFIKDFFFTIVEKEDFISNHINKYADELIELEILQLKEMPQNQQKMLVTHTKLDSSMLNYYIPIKKLGHKLPNGVYYYSFSSEPKSSQILGGLLGTNYLVRIKVKKMNGFIKFYVNEYHKEFI